jgi:uncharacterized protein (DUF1800 family)
MKQALDGLMMLALTVGLVSCSSAPPAPPSPPTASRSPAPRGPSLRTATVLPPSPLTPDQQILHVLDRLGYGPRPGDVERVRQIGLATYIDRQLHPAAIPDTAAERALTAYRTPAMSAAALVSEYPRPAMGVAGRVAAGDMSPEEMTRLYPPERRPNRIVAEMQAAKVTRAVLSERQLEEVMVDFWLNHFNVFAQKGQVLWMLPSYEREAIRPYAMGRFRDLLVATAHHPAMLFYLDNWLSTRSDLVLPTGPRAGRKLGLNENYARELMELHTLGVDGGYTQQDVVEVARCFTGWTIDRPPDGGGFLFRPRVHDDGAKRVLGQLIPAFGGEADGIRVLDLLARHPATARFISSKLVRRFVSDDPPPALVERAAATFQRSDGDIRSVLVTIFTSPEFFSAEAYRAKIKTPLEVVASAARAVGSQLDPPRGEMALLIGGGPTLSRQVAKLGEPLYQAQSPDGYSDRSEAWVSAGALVNRMNFALTLAQGRLPGVRVDLAHVGIDAGQGQSPQVLDQLGAALLHGEATAETRRTLAAELEGAGNGGGSSDARGSRVTDVAKVAGLFLGSPEFQRR